MDKAEKTFQKLAQQANPENSGAVGAGVGGVAGAGAGFAGGQKFNKKVQKRMKQLLPTNGLSGKKGRILTESLSKGRRFIPAALSGILGGTGAAVGYESTDND